MARHIGHEENDVVVPHCEIVGKIIEFYYILLAGVFQIKVRDGLEPSLQDLQSHTLPLCYLTVFNIGE